MRRLLCGLALFGFLPLVNACETSDPTLAVLDNAYSASDTRGNVTVYDGWWSVAAFFAPIAAGAESAPVRVVKGTDTAYVLLARDWEPTLGSPATLIPARTRNELTVGRGDTLHIRIAPETVDCDCATGQPLTQDDADFITQRIFPGEFANVMYDAATCTSSPSADGADGAPNATGSGAAGDSGQAGR